VSAHKEVILFCNGKGAPTDLQPRGALCSVMFTAPPEFGFVSSVLKVRAEAKKAGWTFRRWPSKSRSSRSLDKDFCPEHASQAENPAPKGGAVTPEARTAIKRAYLEVAVSCDGEELKPTKAAHYSLVAAQRATLAKMRELEAGQ
jgi:hypothetical protein